MPIYEFYCPECHAILNFYSKTVNTAKRPACPRCKGRRLQREVSAFAMTGKAQESDGADDLPIDESKMESALNALAGDAERIGDDDPRAAAGLMRKFSRMTGMEFNEGMEGALQRMEAGEDPEKIEEEMGGLAGDDENPFILPGAKGRKARSAREGRAAPFRDKTLYEM